MTAAPLVVRPIAQTAIAAGGAAVVAVYGPYTGGLITNPFTAADQGIAGAPEPLFIDITGAPAALAETATTFLLEPGQTFILPAGGTADITVNAQTSGHRFSGIAYTAPAPYPPTPQPGTFPPTDTTTLSQIIPSYLYVQYNDDADLQAFVSAYNALAQSYTDWFTDISLPVYTGSQIAGPLLDLVAAGIYGMVRPSLSSGQNRFLGPFNTYAYNTLGYNAHRRVGPMNVTVTTDDIFKRIITWNFYKGDGNVFNVIWLKRRIMRFLIGTDGTAPPIDQTYVISVTYAPPNAIAIRITVGTRVVTGGALFNRFGFNQRAVAYNTLMTRFISPPNPLPYESVLKEAIDSGVLALPFQYSVSVVI